MISAMRTLGLDYLYRHIKDNTTSQDDDMEKWYLNLRENNPSLLFNFLVEKSDKIKKVFLLQLENEETDKVVNVIPEDMTETKAKLLPFIKPSGAQSPQVGPIIKRTYSKKAGAGPSSKILKTTMKSFNELAKSESVGAYFSDILEILNAPLIRLADESILNWKEKGYDNLLHAVVNEIGEQRDTVLVAVKDKQRLLPGERKEYIQYLMDDKLSGGRYTTGNAKEHKNKSCPLCRRRNLTIYPNALKGGGINFINVDNPCAFSGVDTDNAWKAYSLCNACADLLYIYRYHFLRKDVNKFNPFITSIAGSSAIVVPELTLDHNQRQYLWKKIEDYIKSSSGDVEMDEDHILDILKEEKGVVNLSFLWASTGQVIDDVTGMITDIPPTRLRELSKFNEKSSTWEHKIFPETFLKTDKISLAPDLSLRALNHLFYRPGGKNAKTANASKSLEQLKREMTETIYHKKYIPENRFWQEFIITAQYYWLDAIKNGTYTLLNEGRKQSGEPFLTSAGWIRHVTWWIYYFKKLEVMQMGDNIYNPQMEKLKPFFGAESGIDTKEKAFAFLMGILYGKLLQVQGARGINVGANALKWLKRLTLRGNDLPELYIKIREKLLSYEVEGNEDVKELINEIGNLGIVLGNKIELDDIPTNYYLLLGQSMTVSVLPSKTKNDN